MQVTKFKFKQHESDLGSLVFLESCKDIPFTVQRVYYIYGVGNDIRRGLHAHKKLHQALICVHGSCKIILDNGTEREEVLLDDPSEGLYVGNHVWREMYDFSPDAVLLVLASEYYEKEDYIHDYDEFIKYVKENSK